MAADCIFCKIVAGEIPATLVRRTDRLVAFRDVSPQAPVHVLVIPTEHLASLADVQDGRLLGEMLLLARDIARDEKIADDGYRVVLNTNRDGGQTVFHLHLHLLGGRRLTWPPG
ncbi:MAG TPA: histidine triad nucleotide-binding protein [Gemmatimonadales bacterium]|nr:histidine triad nucleotide-binding protein [Gemmatimonadales bacterium]